MVCTRPGRRHAEPTPCTAGAVHTWFHLSMRVRHVEQALVGLEALGPVHRAPPEHAQVDVERLRHLLWNDYHQEARKALGRIVRWAETATWLNGAAVAAKAGRLAAHCTGLRAYIENNEGGLIDYGQRYRAGKPISTSRAEGTVNHLVNTRMNKRRQMRWSPRGAPRVLQVRAAVLDGRFGQQPIQLAA
jgi:negative regulator of replication initiation